METQNTMEEQKTITIEEAKEAIHLLKTFTEQRENSALFVTFVIDSDLGLCSYGSVRLVKAALALYAVKSEYIRDIILAVASMLQDDSKEAQEYRAQLKATIDANLDQ